jgi:hypothetical protein
VRGDVMGDFVKKGSGDTYGLGFLIHYIFFGGQAYPVSRILSPGCLTHFFLAT